MSKSSHCTSKLCLDRHTHILCPTDRCFPCTGHPSPPTAELSTQYLLCRHVYIVPIGQTHVHIVITVFTQYLLCLLYRHVHTLHTWQTYNIIGPHSNYWADRYLSYVNTVPTGQTYICPHSSHCTSQVCLHRHTHILCPTDRCFPCTGHPSPPTAELSTQYLLCRHVYIVPIGQTHVHIVITVFTQYLLCLLCRHVHTLHTWQTYNIICPHSNYWADTYMSTQYLLGRHIYGHTVATVRQSPD